MFPAVPIFSPPSTLHVQIPMKCKAQNTKQLVFLTSLSAWDTKTRFINQLPLQKVEDHNSPSQRKNMSRQQEAASS